MNRLPVTTIALVGWLWMLAGGASARAQPGDRDPDFDAGGWPPDYQAAAAVVQSDGSLVMAGTDPWNSDVYSGLVRILPDGRLDGRFHWPTNFDRDGGAGTLAAAPQPEGRIVAGGLFRQLGSTNVQNLIALDAQGRLDPTFNAAPEVQQWAANLALKTLVAQPDGRLLVQLENGHGFEVHLYRLWPDGTLDSSFRTDLEWYSFKALLPLADGRLLVGGRFRRPGETNYSHLARLLADGRADPDYVEPLTLASGWPVTKLLALPDGVLASGPDRSMRLRPDGGFDPGHPDPLPAAFSAGLVVENGILLAVNGGLDLGSRGDPQNLQRWVAISGGNSYWRNWVTEILALPDRSIVAIGSLTTAGGLPRPGFVRIQPDGTPDYNYGRLGPFYSSQIPHPPPRISLLPLPDGRLLVAGQFNYYNGIPRTNLVRLLHDGALDPAFIATGITNLQVSALQRTPDGGILAALSSHLLVKLRPDGSRDPSFQPDLGPIDHITRLVASEDGTIYVSGWQYHPGEPITRRLEATGESDPRFSPPAGIELMAIQHDGRLLARGAKLGFGRHQTNGIVDPTFQRLTNGWVSSVLVLPDDGVIATGQSLDPANHRTAVRWRPDGIRDRLFRLERIGTGDQIGPAPDGHFVLQGAFQYGGEVIGLSRFLPEGAVDPSFPQVSQMEANVGSVVSQDEWLYLWIQHHWNGTVGSDYRIERWNNRAYSLSQPTPDQKDMVFDIIAPVGESHLIEASADLEHWTEAVRVTLPATNHVMVRLPAPGGRQFYRERKLE